MRENSEDRREKAASEKQEKDLGWRTYNDHGWLGMNSSTSVVDRLGSLDSHLKELLHLGHLRSFAVITGVEEDGGELVGEWVCLGSRLS